MRQHGRFLTVMVAALFGIAAVCAAAGHAAAADDPATDRARRTELADRLTAELLGPEQAQARGMQAQPIVSTRTPVAIARERKTALLALMDDAPEEVLRLTLPAAVRETLPSAAQEYLERDIVQEGALQTTIEDGIGFSRHRYTLLGVDGHSRRLHFAGEPPSLPHGSRLVVHGIALDEHVALSSDALAPGEATGMSIVSLAALTGTTGPQRALVILANFADDRSQPYTAGNAMALMLNGIYLNGTWQSVDHFYRESSYQKTWVTGTVVNWVPLSISRGTGCKIGVNMFDEAVSLAAPYVHIPSYQHVIVMTPEQPGCGGILGVAQELGKFTYSTPDGVATTSRLIINSADLDGPGPVTQLETVLTTTAHELGHALGLDHANGLGCGGQTEGSSCNSVEYADGFDVMGNSGRGPLHFNAAHKDRLGWFDPGAVQYLDLSAGADYHYGIGAIERRTVDDGLQRRALKLFGGVGGGGARKYYYIEYRQAVGYDARLAVSGARSNVLNRALIHRASEDRMDTKLLDTTPGSEAGADDFLDAGLRINHFHITLNGINIIPTFHDGRQMYVRTQKICHLLTAAFGRPDHPVIQTLWQTHHRLVGSQWDAPWHQAYLRWYDRVGPTMAGWVAGQPRLRAAIRGAATAAEWMARSWYRLTASSKTPAPDVWDDDFWVRERESHGS